MAVMTPTGSSRGAATVLASVSASTMRPSASVWMTSIVTPLLALAVGWRPRGGGARLRTLGAVLFVSLAAYALAEAATFRFDGAIWAPLMAPVTAVLVAILVEHLVPPDDLRALERETVEAINRVRARRDLAPLRDRPDLAVVAREHSRDMAVGSRADDLKGVIELGDGDAATEQYAQPLDEVLGPF